MSRAPQRLAVGGVSGTKLTPQDPADARQSGPPGLVGANDVSSVLAVEDAWLRIVEHLTVSARNDLICPPIMGNDVRGVPGSVLQNVQRRTVQDHGVAATDVLHQCVRERRSAPEERRYPDLLEFTVEIVVRPQ